MPRRVMVWRGHARTMEINNLPLFRLWTNGATFHGSAGRLHIRRASPINRLAGPCSHNGNHGFLIVLSADGTVGLSVGLPEDGKIGLARRSIGWRDHARTMQNLTFLLVRLGTERCDLPRVCRKITYSACLANLIDWRNHARTMVMIDLSRFRLRTERLASRWICKRIANSARLDD